MTEQQILNLYSISFTGGRKDTRSHIFQVFEVWIVLNCFLYLLLEVIKAVEMFRQLGFLSTGFPVKIVS